MTGSAFAALIAHHFGARVVSRVTGVSEPMVRAWVERFRAEVTGKTSPAWASRYSAPKAAHLAALSSFARSISLELLDAAARAPMPPLTSSAASGNVEDARGTMTPQGS